MLSRAPAEPPDVDDYNLDLESQAFVNYIVESLPASEQQLQRIKQFQRQDQVCKQIIQFCQTTWPDKTLLSQDIQPYYSMASEISVENGLLMRGCRIVIPSELQQEMLNKIHDGHLGITKCRARARQSIWWPGLSKQLEEKVKQCSECCKNQLQRAEPLMPTQLPELPWQKIGTDLFHWKSNQYLLIVDYYSRYIEISKLSRTTAEDIISHTKSIFARHGIPEVVYSDNGPQFSSDAYKQFALEYQFTHSTGSPYFPQSNGEAEQAVGIIKSLLKREGDPYLAY